MGAKANHIEAAHFLTVPCNFLVPLPLFFSQITSYRSNKKLKSAVVSVKKEKKKKGNRGGTDSNAFYNYSAKVSN